MNPNYLVINVQQAIAEPDSIFHYYQKLIGLRKKYPIVVYGKYDLILAGHEQIYAFTRTLNEERLLVILNFTQEMPVFDLPEAVAYSTKELLISNYPVDAAEDIRQVTMRPYEARVYRFV